MPRLDLYRPEQLFNSSILSQQGLRFFMDLQRFLGKINGIDWSLISKEGASLTDIDPAAAATLTRHEDHVTDGSIHHTLEAIQDDIAAMLTGGNAVTLSYSDAANTLTIAVNKVAASANTAITVTGTAGDPYTAAEQAMINALVVDVTTLNNALNGLKANMRTAGHLDV